MNISKAPESKSAMASASARSVSGRIHQIPSDLCLNIFSYLQAKDLCVVMRVCVEWYNILNKDASADKRLWEPLFMHDYFEEQQRRKNRTGEEINYDPYAPKKPLTAFQLFLKDQLEAAGCEEHHAQSIVVMASRRRGGSGIDAVWQNVSHAVKQRYIDMEVGLLLEYNELMRAYKKNKFLLEFEAFRKTTVSQFELLWTNKPLGNHLLFPETPYNNSSSSSNSNSNSPDLDLTREHRRWMLYYAARFIDKKVTQLQQFMANASAIMGGDSPAFRYDTDDAVEEQEEQLSRKRLRQLIPICSDEESGSINEPKPPPNGFYLFCCRLYSSRLSPDYNQIAHATVLTRGLRFISKWLALTSSQRQAYEEKAHQILQKWEVLCKARRALEEAYLAYKRARVESLLLNDNDYNNHDPLATVTAATTTTTTTVTNAFQSNARQTIPHPSLAQAIASPSAFNYYQHQDQHYRTATAAARSPPPTTPNLPGFFTTPHPIGIGAINDFGLAHHHAFLPPPQRQQSNEDRLLAANRLQQFILQVTSGVGQQRPISPPPALHHQYLQRNQQPQQQQQHEEGMLSAHLNNNHNNIFHQMAPQQQRLTQQRQQQFDGPPSSPPASSF